MATAAYRKQYHEANWGQQKQRVLDWNARHPPGTRVGYWDGKRFAIAKTKGPAALLGRDAVVWLWGVPGCFLLDALIVEHDK